MRLRTSSGEIITDPTEDDISRVLSNEKWVVLEKEAGSYLEFSKSRDPSRWRLGYQIGSLENHFRTVRASLTLEKVGRTFDKYLKGEETWQSDFEWERKFIQITKPKDDIATIESGSEWAKES